MMYLTKITILGIIFTTVDPLLPYDFIAAAYVIYPLIITVQLIKRAGQ
jgi:hypothetical protein